MFCVTSWEGPLRMGLVSREDTGLGRFMLGGNTFWTFYSYNWKVQPNTVFFSSSKQYKTINKKPNYPGSAYSKTQWNILSRPLPTNRIFSHYSWVSMLWLVINYHGGTVWMGAFGGRDPQCRQFLLKGRCKQLEPFRVIFILHWLHLYFEPKKYYLQVL